jgi:serine/threonine protein kinase
MYETQTEIDAFFKCLVQFRPVKQLGKGGFGLALLVYDEVEEAQKVFKLPRDQETTNALIQEGANLRKLEELYHPNIIRLYQLGKVRLTWNDEVQDRYYLNMAYGGTSLRAKLGSLRIESDANGNPVCSGSGRRLPIEVAVRIACDACGGLEAAHGFRGAAIRMLHRDISPDNILIDDETGNARLSDFGLSRVIDRSSAVVSFGGKLPYMALECFRGAACMQSDIYSMGIVLYEMVTGDLPFPTYQDRLDRPARPPRDIDPDIPSQLNDVILHCLENDLKSRYQNAAELLIELRRIQAMLNPIPPRYTSLATLSDGRRLCDDADTGECVAIRLVCTDAPLAEFAHQCSRLEEMGSENIEIPLRHFHNEQFIGIVSRPPRSEELRHRFGKQGATTLDQIRDLCDVAARVCDILQELHNVGLCHGLLNCSSITEDSRGGRLHDLGATPVLRARRVIGKTAESLRGFEAALPFMSPQLLMATRDPIPADDVYSLGCILLFFLTGMEALDEDERVRLIAGGTVIEPNHNARAHNRLIPPNLAATVAKAMYFNPIDRFQKAAEFSVALREIRWPEDSVHGLIEDALAMFSEGGSPKELLEASSYLDQALSVAPGSLDAHAARGKLYFRDGSYRYAVEEFEKVSRVCASHTIFDLLGQSYSKWGQDSRAIEAYRKALEVNEDPGTLDRLGRCLNKAGRHTEAQLVMKRALEVEPDESIRERRRLLLQSWKQGASTPAEKDDDVEDQNTNIQKVFRPRSGEPKRHDESR